MYFLQTLIILGSIVFASCQRPLNTTTNTTSVLTDPFFVKPTVIIPKGYNHPDVRSAYDSTTNRNRNRTERIHFQNLDQIPPPSLLDVQQPNRIRQQNKKNNLNTIRNLLKANGSRIFEPQHSYGRQESKPMRLEANPHNNSDLKNDSRPSSRGESLQKIKELQKNQDNQHTPSPPSYNSDDTDVDEKLGVKCSFEKPCAWTYDTNIPGDNFEVTTGVHLKESNVTGKFLFSKLFRMNLTLNLFLLSGVTPGPQADNINDANGHFLHLHLTPVTGTRILKSPVFSSTREKCYLEAFLHQSSMLKGSIRIVIEPVGELKKILSSASKDSRF